MSRTLLILNPEAGAIRGDPRLLTHLQAHPALKGTELVPTGSPWEVRDQARRAREEGREHLLVAGGDGTIHHAVNGLLEGLDAEELPPAETQPILSVLPMGTGNDLARSLGLSLAPWKALEEMDWGRTRLMDLIRVRGPDDAWCVNVVTGGMPVLERVTPEPEAKAALGILAYARSGLEVLEEDLPLYETLLTLEGEDRHTFRARSLVVGNGRFAGGALPVTPTATLDDGLLDLLVVPELDLAEMSLLLPRLVLGRHEDHEALFTRRCRQIHLRSDPAMDLSLDGEPTRAREATFQVVERGLRILVGPNEDRWAFGVPRA